MRLKLEIVMTEEMRAFLNDLSELLYKHKAIIELGDYAADFGRHNGRGLEWTGFKIESEISVQSINGLLDEK